MAKATKTTKAKKTAAKPAKTTGKRGRPPGTAKAKSEDAPEAVAPKKAPKIFNSQINEEEKALFLRHLPKIKNLKALLGTANANLRNAYKTAKGEGFEKSDFDHAFALETAEQEARERGKIARQLTIAKFVGSDLGAQLDMFLEPTRVPAEDRAAEEGQRDSMSGKSAAPKYDPSTPQYRAYMQAYNDDQANRIRGGIKQLAPAVEVPGEFEAAAPKVAETRLITKDEKEARAAALADAKEREAAEKAKPPLTTPSSGTPMTRSEFMKSQRDAKNSAKAAAEALFTKKDSATA